MSRHLAQPQRRPGSRPRRSRRRGPDRRAILVVALLAALAAVLLLVLNTCGKQEAPPDIPDDPEPTPPPVVDEPEPQPEPEGDVNPLTGLYDGISESAIGRRPVALMVSNSYDSLPQWGISQADIIYEMLAEGRITRLLAIFQDPSKIEALASIRSARPYFIDIAQSYGAVYMHFGGSVPAYDAIASRKDLLSADGIRGGWEGSLFIRDPERRKQIGYEHSVYTDGEKIEEALPKISDDLSLSGSPSAFCFGEQHSARGGTPASKITVTYSSRNQPWYEYDAASGQYLRFQYGEAHMDAYQDKQVSVKNLFVLRMATRDVPNNALGLVEVTTTGSGSGYYFCDGKMTEITWEKDAYNAPILFFDKNGDELTVCPGQTFVSVVTETADVTIE